jgi:NADPH-dependent ferric siderophore reductase
MIGATMPKTAQPPRAQQTTRLVVRRAERLTPHLIRITAIPANPTEISRFAELGHTDAYVKVIFRRPGVRYPEPFDMARARAELPREQWPALRSYTLREVDPRTAEVVIDFVYHGETGLAGPWAAAATAGSELLVLGPGGNYAPDPTADWHLLVGDEAALPAIAAALARVPAGVPVRAVVEVEDARDEQPLRCPGDLRLDWLHRGGRPAAPQALVEHVRGMRFPAGRVHAFVHGEAGAVKLLRRHLLDERGLRLDQLSISGYWRRGFDDEGHRALKTAEREAEEAAHA